MSMYRSVGIAILMALICNAGSALANQTYMEFTFDDKVIDQPIGVGGATVGEPSYVAAVFDAFVRSTPFETPSLEIHNASPMDNGSIWFNMPGSPAAEGTVVIIMDLWLYGSGPGWESKWTVYTSSYQDLMSLELWSDGAVRLTGAELDATIPSYPIGRIFPILIKLDMDADTYSAWTDGIQRVADEPLRLKDADFGAIWFSSTSDAAPDNRVSIDQIRVLDWMPDDVPIVETTWGRVRALYR
jgi:hypothetical protein